MNELLPWVATLGFWWVAGWVPAMPAFFFLARFSRGPLQLRKEKAAWRTLLWPLAIIALVVQVLDFGLAFVARAGSGLMLLLATNSDDRDQQRLELDKRNLEIATREADEAEQRSALMDCELQAQRIAEALDDPQVRRLEITEQEKKIAAAVLGHVSVTEPHPDKPHGMVHYVPQELSVQVNAKEWTVFGDVKDRTLVWRHADTGVWQAVTSTSDVPARWPVWQVDWEGKNQRMGAVKLKFWGYRKHLHPGH